MGGIEEQDQSRQEEKSGWQQWLKGMGIGAFLFFFIKGLVWLAIFFGAASFFAC